MPFVFGDIAMNNAAAECNIAALSTPSVCARAPTPSYTAYNASAREAAPRFTQSYYVNLIMACQVRLCVKITAAVYVCVVGANVALIIFR